MTLAAQQFRHSRYARTRGDVFTTSDGSDARIRSSFRSFYGFPSSERWRPRGDRRHSLHLLIQTSADSRHQLLVGTQLVRSPPSAPWTTAAGSPRIPDDGLPAQPSRSSPSRPPPSRPPPPSRSPPSSSRPPPPSSSSPLLPLKVRSLSSSRSSRSSRSSPSSSSRSPLRLGRSSSPPSSSSSDPAVAGGSPTVPPGLGGPDPAGPGSGAPDPVPPGMGVPPATGPSSPADSAGPGEGTVAGGGGASTVDTAPGEDAGSTDGCTTNPPGTSGPGGLAGTTAGGGGSSCTPPGRMPTPAAPQVARPATTGNASIATSSVRRRRASTVGFESASMCLWYPTWMTPG